jgi:putative ABC transport system ATP-binding protein
MSERIFETKRLSKVFIVGGEEIKAVNNVDLTLSQGEFLGIMGPSGSGKTTLLNLIGCLDRPTSGKLFFEGKDTSLLKDKELDLLRLRKIGFIFQTFNLLPTLTAMENVMLPMMIGGMNLRQREGRAKQLLSWVGLSHRLKHYPKQLSAGESQRVAIARALANLPLLILADEPTGNLDLKSKEEIASLLKRVNMEYGTAILLVTHDPSIAKVAAKVLPMVDGRIKEAQSDQ